MVGNGDLVVHHRIASGQWAMLSVSALPHYKVLKWLSSVHCHIVGSSGQEHLVVHGHIAREAVGCGIHEYTPAQQQG